MNLLAATALAVLILIAIPAAGAFIAAAINGHIKNAGAARHGNDKGGAL